MPNAGFFDNLELLVPPIYNQGRKAQIEAEAQRLEVMRQDQVGLGKTFSEQDPEVRKKLLNLFAAAQLSQFTINMAIIQNVLNEGALQDLVVKRDTLKSLPIESLPPEHAILRAMKSATEDLSFIKLAKALVQNMLNLIDQYEILITYYIDSSVSLLSLQSNQAQKVFDDFHLSFQKILERHNGNDGFFDANELAYLSNSKSFADYLSGIDKPPEYTETAEITPPSYAEAIGMQPQPNPNTQGIFEKLMQDYPYDPTQGISKEVYTSFVARMSEVFANRGFTANDMSRKNAATDAAKHFCRPSPNMWREAHVVYETAIKKLEAIHILYKNSAKELDQNAQKLEQIKKNMRAEYNNALELIKKMPAGPEMDQLLESVASIRNELNKSGLPPTSAAPDYISDASRERWDTLLAGRPDTERRTEAEETQKARFPSFKPVDSTTTEDETKDSTLETKGQSRRPRPEPQRGRKEGN